MARKGGVRHKATLAYTSDTYTPQGLQKMSDKALRAEYSRLRSIARKRLERMSKTEWAETQTYERNAGKYIPLKNIGSDRRALERLTIDLSKYITAKTSSIKGQEVVRDASLQALHQHGYDFVTKENYIKFGKFMEYAETSKEKEMLGSLRVAQYFADEEEKGSTLEEMKENFTDWVAEQYAAQERRAAITRVGLS